MKAAFYFLRRELASVALILLSLIPILIIGSILDFLLTHLYAHVENGKTVLPIISQWIYDSIAGHRFLIQEIMASFWTLMVLCFMINAFIATDQQVFLITLVG